MQSQYSQYYQYLQRGPSATQSQCCCQQRGFISIRSRYSQCCCRQRSVGQHSLNTLNATIISPIRLGTIQSQYSQCLCHQREDSGQYSLNTLNAVVIRDRTQDNTVSILSMPLSSERGHRYRMVMIIPWWVRRFWRQNMLRKALRNPVLRKQ